MFYELKENILTINKKSKKQKIYFKENQMETNQKIFKIEMKKFTTYAQQNS